NEERRGEWKNSILMLVMLAVVFPQLLWRIRQGALAAPGDFGFRPKDVLAFLAWQLVLFGPVPLYLLLRGGRFLFRASESAGGEAPTQDVRQLLACLSLPFLAGFMLLSGLRPGLPGAAAFSFVAAVPLVSAAALGGAGTFWMRGSILVQGLIGVGLCALIW